MCVYMQGGLHKEDGGDFYVSTVFRILILVLLVAGILVQGTHNIFPCGSDHSASVQQRSINMYFLLTYANFYCCFFH